MNSSDSLMSTPLKSKASRSINSKSPVSKTPEKRSSQLPNRARNRGVALSIKEIRQVAQTRSKAPTEQINSARKQILPCPTESPPPKASGRRPDELPEKYEMLCEFYNSLDSAIRLLRSKGSMPTFTNISRKVECLTDRRFLYSHLAQLKHILPEAIEIKRMLVFDEMTSCMKPDLHISIILDAIDFGDNSNWMTKNLKLRKVFRSRLVDFSNAHPEGDEIPEDDLPEPFNRSKQSLQLNASSIDTLTEQKSLAVQAEDIQNEVEPHLSNRTKSNSKLAPEICCDRSFRKFFSLKTTNKTQQALQNCSNFQVPEICCDRSAPSPTKFLPKQTTSETQPKNCLPATPVKELTPSKTEDESPKKAASIDSTPVELLSTPAKLVRRPPRTRSLKFEEKLVDEVHEMAGKPADIDKDDVLSILPESLRHSIREKERKALEQRDPAISQAKRRQRMIACLPKLYNMIHYFFQSIKRSVITKEELMHKLIAGHCDISDRGEVEEQLKLFVTPLEFQPGHAALDAPFYENKRLSYAYLVQADSLDYDGNVNAREIENKERDCGCNPGDSPALLLNVEKRRENKISDLRAKLKAK